MRVSYSGLPGRRSYDGESNWLADRHEVVAMNQPHMAPWWFPSNDHPADKALMDISITVPSGKKVVANGQPVGRERRGSRVTHHWRADEPMATYLAMFAAGPFHVEHQVATRTSVLPVRLPVSERLPRPLPGEPEDAAPYAARCSASSSETWATTPSPPQGAWSPASRSGSPSRTRRSRRTSGRPPGDWDWWWSTSRPTSGSVTRSRSSGGPTSGSTRGRRRSSSPPTRNSAGNIEDADAWLERRTSSTTPTPRFRKLEIADPGASRIFANAIYYRGGMAFQALRNRIGEEDYCRPAARVRSTYEGGNATTEDFEAMAEDVSGQDLDGFFDAWIRDTDKPDHTEANGPDLTG